MNTAITTTSNTLKGTNQSFDLQSVHAIIPEMEGDDYQALKESIAQHGLLSPVVKRGGNVIDGRARIRACEELGIKSHFIELPEAANDSDYVVQMNTVRRHLNTVQRAFIAEGLASLRRGDNQHTAAAACTRSEAAKIMGVSSDSIDRARLIKQGGSEKLVSMVMDGRLSLSKGAEMVRFVADKEEQDAAIDKGIEIFRRQKYREEVLAEKRSKAQNLAQNNTAAIAALSGIYSVIYADPPWNYGGSTEGSFCDPSVHYPLMNTQEIMALNVKGSLTDDAVLFLWVPNCLLADGLAVLAAWGFSYVNMMVWCKDNAVMTTGATKTAHETLLIGKKGKSFHQSEGRIFSWHHEKRDVHSKKPEAFAKMLDDMYPGFPKLEMFARKPRGKDWSVFGNQVVGLTDVVAVRTPVDGNEAVPANDATFWVAA